MRLFTRVYLVILVMVLLGLFMPMVTVWANAGHNIEALRRIYHGQMVMASEAIRSAEDRELAIQELKETFEFDVELVDWPTEELPRGSVFWLRFGKTLIWMLPEKKVVGYHLVDRKSALRFGPLPELRWLGKAGWIGFGLVIVLGGFLILWFVVRPMKRQGRALIFAANAMSAGNLSVQVQPKRVRDLADLGRAFNRMANRLRGVLIAQRQLLQDVSHELRTPLARVRFGLEMLREEVVEHPRGDHLLSQIDDTIDQLDRLVGELLEYTRLADQDRLLGRNESLDLKEIVERSLDRISLERERGLRVETFVPDGELPKVVGNRQELGRALDNLVDNALRYAKEQVHVVLRITETDFEISVEDDGPGVPPDRRLRVLEPFVQLERDHAHTGLGLAIVCRIVEGHGGAVEVDDSAALGGTAIRLRIPRGDPIALSE